MSARVMFAGTEITLTVELQLLAELKAADRLLEACWLCMSEESRASFSHQAMSMGLCWTGDGRRLQRAAAIARAEGGTA